MCSSFIYVLVNKFVNFNSQVTSLNGLTLFVTVNGSGYDKWGLIRDGTAKPLLVVKSNFVSCKTRHIPHILYWYSSPTFIGPYKLGSALYYKNTSMIENPNYVKLSDLMKLLQDTTIVPALRSQ